MISRLIMLFLLLSISYFVESFLFNSKQVSKIQKLWNKSLQQQTVKVDDEIETLIDNYKGDIYNEKFIKGCYQSKPLITNNGDVPTWQKYSSFIEQITKKSSNKNYQIFSSNSNKFFNLSEYNGNDFFATASGTYNKLENRNDIAQANVTEICVYFQFLQKLRKLSFNVNGNGIINIVYEDKDSYRIVKNEKGARAIQKKVPVPRFYEDLLKI